MKVRNFQFSIFNFQLGFTLVELLVVITIIALLTTMGMVMYQNANKKGRDGRRQSDMEQVRTALELYYDDNSAYPDVLDDLTPDYIRAIPGDPREYEYYYSVADPYQEYSLCAHLEAAVDQSDLYCGPSDNCGGSCNYQVQNP